MSTDDSLKQRLEQLRRAYESGLLDEDTYQAAVAGLSSTTTTTVEKRGVLVGGSVGGSIITGNVYHGPPTHDPAEAIRIYCRVLAQSTGNLPLRGIDVGASDPAGNQQPLSLAHVYVALDTRTQVRKEGGSREETRPLAALEAVVQQRRLVLTGDPGGGKSTFASHLAHCLAAHIAEPQGKWLKALPQWPAAETDTVPILVVLRDFAHSLPQPLPARAEAHHLWDFIGRRLQAQNLDFVAEPLRQRLEAGQVLLLFDGLDEVVTPEQRAFVRDALLAFLRRYSPENRVLVTCRVLAYQPPAEAGQPDLRLPLHEFPIFELAPFDEEKIERFIAAWYAELVRQGSVRPEEEQRLAQALGTAVQRPDLRRLAGNPLLLTVIALVHTHRGRLPDARALLYEETIEMLLWRWEEVKAGTPPLRQLLAAAGRSELELRKLLWRLAYEAHQQAGEGEQPAGIGELQLKRALAKLAQEDWNWAHQVVQTMKLRAGLLLERDPGVFTFPHRTFQEYLAGAHLSVQPGFALQATELAGQGANWREAILLAVGRLVHLTGDTSDKPLALVERLCPVQAVDQDVAWRKAWLAGDVLLEMGLNWITEDSWGQALLERVRGRLVALVSGGKLSPRERAEAGTTLSRLGDPRPGVCTLEPELIPIPAGTFLMGKKKHEITLEAFAIARYPVTNAQFRVFWADGGYTEKWQNCWTTEGWQWRNKDGWTEPRFWDDERLNQDNQPVVGVSWYEAIAYTNWLARQTSRPYCLPTEAQWERAARHTDGREYPWGDAWREDAANTEEMGLGRPTAVGAFPAGAGVAGVLDMSGNVWEWCSTRWRDEQGQMYSSPYRPDDGREVLSGSTAVWRVLRGGSWYDGKQAAGCSARDRHVPAGYFLDLRGFRVAVSPFVSEL